jgi:putative component of membrane protein insertase Oxa1/YidC/SpoIIIJ protein YidD
VNFKMQFLILKLISFYQIFLSFDRGVLAVLAPGGACIYEISCSEYTKREIMKHGVLKGSLNGVRRIISCR